jgi:hypothetical protein
MAEPTNGVTVVKEMSIIGLRKLIAYIIGNVMIIILSFAGKLNVESISSTLLILNAGYFGANAASDLGKVVKDAIAKRNGSSGGSVTTTTPPA